MPLNQRGVLSLFQHFIPISAFYPHFSVLSPFQRFIPISVSVFSFSFRHSVSAFYPNPQFQLVKHQQECRRRSFSSSKRLASVLFNINRHEFLHIVMCCSDIFACIRVRIGLCFAYMNHCSAASAR